MHFIESAMLSVQQPAFETFCESLNTFRRRSFGCLFAPGFVRLANHSTLPDFLMLKQNLRQKSLPNFKSRPLFVTLVQDIDLGIRTLSISRPEILYPPLLMMSTEVRPRWRSVFSDLKMTLPSTTTSFRPMMPIDRPQFGISFLGAG